MKFFSCLVFTLTLFLSSLSISSGNASLPEVKHQNSTFSSPTGNKTASSIGDNTKQPKDGVLKNIQNYLQNRQNSQANFNKSLLATLKLQNRLTATKKVQFPTIVLHNEHEKAISEDISDDLTKFEAYSKLLSKLMHSIADKDLGLGIMKKSIESLNATHREVKFEYILDELTDKISKKIDEIHTVIEETGERVQEIFKQQYSSNISTSFISCCDFYAKEYGSYYHNLQSNPTVSGSPPPPSNSHPHMLHSQHYHQQTTSSMNEPNKRPEVKYNYDPSFNSHISRERSCDIADHFRPHFFTPSGPNLTAQFRQNLQQSSTEIRWQYFMSFHGIHTEFPAYLPPINYCFMHNIEHAHMVGDRLQFDAVGQIFAKHLQRRYQSKLAQKKHDLLQQHRKAYSDLNQLFIQRHRENLLSTALPSHKLVVIVIDRGSAITDHQMNIAKSVAKYILNSLSHRDRVALVDLTSDVFYPSADVCSSKLEIAFANYETKFVLGRFIDEMQRSHNSTNHLQGFKRAFEIISSNYHRFKAEIDEEPEVFIPYISRGLLASLADAKPVMELIANELMNQTYNFVINCYAPIDSTKPIMFETSFLKEVSLMNFRKFAVEPPPFNKIRSGLMIELNSTDNLGFTLNGIYNVLRKPKQDEIRELYVSLPNYDFISKDVHVSLSKAFFHRDMFLGILGVDVAFSELASSVLNHAHQSTSYAFLMESYSGRVLYHPQLPSRKRPGSSHTRNHNFRFESSSSATSAPGSGGNSGNSDLLNMLINVEHIEQWADFPSLKKRIMSEDFGSATIELVYPVSEFTSGPASNEGSFGYWNDRQFILQNFKTVTYYWKRVPKTSYIVVLTEYGTGTEIVSKFEPTFTVNRKYDYELFVHHRLDFSSLLHGDSLRLCKYFNQLATLDTSGLYLTATAFEKRLDSRRGQIGSIEDLMFYLGNEDNNSKAPNPGMKPNVRSDISLMAQMTVHWKKLLHSSENSKYIVRKYIMSVSGAFMIYPATMLDPSYEPSTRPWYTRAMNSPGKLIFLPPYLDVGGSGYIVTLSHAVQLQNTSVWAVMGIDLTLGYFHKIIDEIVPFCNSEKSSCFLMDDYGYLIVHSSFLKPPTALSFDRIHITHKEPQMVNDLLNQKHFVRKLVCNSYNDRTIQRTYMFNTNLVGIMTNIVQSKEASCVKYKLVTLDATNAFFGVVNHSCDNSTTFCPCSLTDRLCLNCHRMEQTDCECPCECPLVMNMCSGELAEREDQNPACDLVPEALKEVIPPKYLLEPLDTCINSECFQKSTESECKGVLGCEWCSMESGEPLKKPFCSKQNVCFGGVFGSKNPYLGQNYHYHHREFKPLDDSPIGPLTTIIIVCFVILTISVYCFHFNSSRGLTQRYLNTHHHQHERPILPGNDLHEPEQELPIDPQEGVAGMIHVPHFENVPSPYQVNSNYRRPRVESDYGYSTMSPNGDSEPNRSIFIEEHVPENGSKAKAKTVTKNYLVYNSTETSSSGDDNLSTLSLPSTSSSVKTSFPLPPPPSSSKGSRRVRSKLKYSANDQKKLLKTLDVSTPEIV